MRLEELVALLDKTPVAAEMHPASLIYLPEDIVVFESAIDAVAAMDDPHPIQSGRWLILGKAASFLHRFPQVLVEHDPFTPELNTRLLDHFGRAQETILCQSNVASSIAAGANETDVIIFMLVDGLSYHEVSSWVSRRALADGWRLEPCLVDVPTLTHIAFPNIIGTHSLAERLFDIGFHRRIGFSYWTRNDNMLTDTLFRTIPTVQKMSDFSDIIRTISKLLSESVTQEKTYIQVLRTGLDGYAHHQKRLPPIEATVDVICKEFSLLAQLGAEVQAATNQRVRVYLTADHGILWRKDFEINLVGTAPPTSSARWCLAKELYHQSEKGWHFEVDGLDYYSLGYPSVRRPLRIDEQGVHGGISFQESIVPFLIAEA